MMNVSPFFISRFSYSYLSRGREQIIIFSTLNSVHHVLIHLCKTDSRDVHRRTFQVTVLQVKKAVLTRLTSFCVRHGCKQTLMKRQSWLLNTYSYICTRGESDIEISHRQKNMLKRDPCLRYNKQVQHENKDAP